MHPLHDYVAKQLAERIKSRKVVVWYDPRSEFPTFVDELRGGARTDGVPVPVSPAGISAKLVEFAGSLFELRAAVEPLTSGDTPEAVVIYLPACEHEERTSVLLELEKSGCFWKPSLKQLARNLLQQKYTQGMLDELLPPARSVSYADLAHTASAGAGSEPPSVLKSIFRESATADGLIAAWLASDERDEEIQDKGATAELVKLIRSYLGLELAEDAVLAKQRAVVSRYVLAGEFRADLSCNAPSSLESVPVAPASKLDAVRKLAASLRTRYPEAYAPLANRVEEELNLGSARLPAKALGSIDTFRFEERTLLGYCCEQIAASQFDEAMAVITEREHCFWLDRNLDRKAQWEACRRMATLGQLAAQVRGQLSRANGNAVVWLERYTAKDGWYRLDQAQRRLESWVASLDEEPDERALGMVRRAYEDACQAMADGFTKALAKAGWSVAGALHQSKVFSEVVAARPKPVAYFLVDAMRYEMGVELAERLPQTSEISVRAAVGSLPSITPIGMAALQPGASGSFSVVEQGGRLGSKIDDVFLPDLTARKKLAAARVPKLVDLSLDELLGLQKSKLAAKLDGAQVVMVRSQEIDHAGEAGFNFQARQVMDTVIDNLARAIRRLAAAGVEHAVVSADHGHLFFATDRDVSMRTDAPGGQTIELHRRCWIGRGGATPPGCVRVSASALGYDSDLDFVFPSGSGVFKAGGDLAFHHGGTSLQEMVIPVISILTKGTAPAKASMRAVTVEGLPQSITNRIFTVTLSLGDRQMQLDATGLLVRPLLVSAGRQIGAVVMVVDAEFDRATGCVTLEPNKPLTVAFLLADENAPSLRLVVQDPGSDAELYRSPADIAIRLGM